jgi:dTDP-4-amino-4,6-dideoxygalactose transaminase
MGVHLWGHACETDALSAIARRHNLRLLFDAAHAFGCSDGSRPIGGFGDAEVFSFHGTKFINAFEGGAIVTNDDAVAERARLIRNFGFADYDTVVCAGMNGKMNEASAAIGLTSLESAQEFLAANKRNYEAYRSCLADIDGLTPYTHQPTNAATCAYVVVTIDGANFGMTRDCLKDVLWAEQVMARRYFHPGCHRSEPYASDPATRRDLPVTEALSETVLVLPTGTATSVNDIEAICQIIRLAAKNPWIAANTASMGAQAA